MGVEWKGNMWEMWTVDWGFRNGYFANGLLECVLENKNVSFMRCWAQPKFFSSDLNSRMVASDSSDMTNARISCYKCVEYYMKH